MLLGNLSSCCNPWIYMGFNGHLWPRSLGRLACCGGPGPRMCRQLSSGSPSNRRAMLLTRSSGLPTLSQRPGPEDPLKDEEQVDRDTVTETSIF